MTRVSNRTAACLSAAIEVAARVRCEQGLASARAHDALASEHCRHFETTERGFRSIQTARPDATAELQCSLPTWPLQPAGLQRQPLLLHNSSTPSPGGLLAHSGSISGGVSPQQLALGALQLSERPPCFAGHSMDTAWQPPAAAAGTAAVAAAEPIDRAAQQPAAACTYSARCAAQDSTGGPTVETPAGEAGRGWVLGGFGDLLARQQALLSHAQSQVAALTQQLREAQSEHQRHLQKVRGADWGRLAGWREGGRECGVAASMCPGYANCTCSMCG